MYTLYIPDKEYWDEANERFVNVKGGTIHLEHSLKSLSKWEAKHKKYLIGNPEITTLEFIDYIRCMTIDKNVPDTVYMAIDQTAINAIKEYMNDPMTATWFNTTKKSPPSREKITNELIYYWLVALNIPFEPCEKWHINHLLTLIEVCNHKNQPPKKMSAKEAAAYRRSLNASRKHRLGTKG